MYQVLYRKWRPRFFADVAGQPQVTVTLKNELRAGRVGHAYLFTGSRGTGKTTCAKILAKAVNCLNPQDGDPCGECEICRGIDSGAVMDVVEIDAASNNGVENIRNLREEASFTPASAKYRVYIIDEVHMLSTGAFNALLKTLEEPPAHVVFILATTEVHKLPATILSRCQRFDFHRIAPEDISARLRYVAEQEGASLDEEAALLIARLSDGALRDALSLLDQCIGRDRSVTEQVVTETAGLAGTDHLFSLADAVRSHDGASALEQIDRLHAASKDMARLCEELIGHFRNLMLFNTLPDPRKLVPLSRGEYEKTLRQAGEFSLDQTIHALDALQSAQERIFRGGNRRVEMEMCLLKLCSPALDSTADAMLRRIAQLERAVKAGIPSAAAPPASAAAEPPRADAAREVPAKQSAPLSRPAPDDADAPPSPRQDKPAPAPSPAKPAEAPVSLEALQTSAERMTSWPEVLQVLKGYSQVIASAFSGSSAYISGDYVLIDAPNSMAFELLRKSAQRDKMRVAIQEVTGRVYKLGPYQPAAAREEKKKNDPLEEFAAMAENAGVTVAKIKTEE